MTKGQKIFFQWVSFFATIFFAYFLVASKAEAAVIYTQGDITNPLHATSGAISITFGTLSGSGNVGDIRISVGHSDPAQPGYSTASIVGSQIQFALYESNYSTSPCTNGNPASSTYWTTLTSDSQTTYDFDVSSFNCPISQTYAIDVIVRASGTGTVQNIAFPALGTYGSPNTFYFEMSDSAGFPAPTSTITKVYPTQGNTGIAGETSTTTAVDIGLTPTDFSAGSTTIAYTATGLDGQTPQSGSFTATSSGSALHFSTNIFGAGYWQVLWTLQGTCGSDCPDPGYNYYVATTTYFTVGNFSQYQSVNSTQATSSPVATSTAVQIAACQGSGYLNDITCSIGSVISAIFQWLFQPSAAAVGQFSNFKDTLYTRVPVGYFVTVYTVIQSVSASSTPTFALSVPQPFMDSIFTPIRTGLAWIITLGIAIWLYKRVSKAQIF